MRLIEDTTETQDTMIPDVQEGVTIDREIVTIIQPSRGWVSLKLKELWEPLDRSIQPDYTSPI